MSGMMERLHATVRYDMSTRMQQLTLGKSCDALRTAFCLGCQKCNLFGVPLLIPGWPSEEWIVVLCYCLQNTSEPEPIVHRSHSEKLQQRHITASRLDCVPISETQANFRQLVGQH